MFGRDTKEQEGSICILNFVKQPPARIWGEGMGSISHSHRPRSRFRAESSSLIRHDWSSRRDGDLRFLRF